MLSIMFFIVGNDFFYFVNDLLKFGWWGILSAGAIILIVLFYRGLNNNFEKNFRKGLLLILISFLCGIIMIAVSLYTFSGKKEHSRPTADEVKKIFLD